ncbi:hypothetical protein HMPREF3189_00373 [Clostridiales bacterium KA00134]|nr:hypothetical protein HMPREF3189_00373 [Clostridiales bacterium KA00134]
MKISNRICAILLAGIMLVPSTSVWAEEDTQNKSSQIYQTRDAGDSSDSSDSIPIAVQSIVSAKGLNGDFPWNTYFKNMGYGQIGVYKQWITYFKDTSSYQADPNEGSHFSTGYEDGTRPKNIPTLTWSFDIPPLTGEFYGFHTDNNFSQREDIPATYEESTGWIQEKAHHSVWNKGELYGVYTMETKIMEYNKPILNVIYKDPYGGELSDADKGRLDEMVPKELRVKFLTSDRATNDDIDSFELPKSPGEYNLWEIGEKEQAYVFDSYAFTKEVPKVDVQDDGGYSLLNTPVWRSTFADNRRVKSIEAKYEAGKGGEVKIELMPKILDVPLDTNNTPKPVPAGYKRITLDANGSTIGNKEVKGKIVGGNYDQKEKAYIDVRDDLQWNDYSLLQKLREVVANGNNGETQNEEHPWKGQGLDKLFIGNRQNKVQEITLKADYTATALIMPKEDVPENPGNNYVTLTLHGTSQTDKKERGDGKLFRDKDGNTEAKGNQVNFWLRKGTPIDFATIEQIKQVTDGFYPKADSQFMSFKSWHTDERATDANMLGKIENGHYEASLMAQEQDINLYASYKDENMASKWKDYLKIKDLEVLHRRILDPSDEDISSISDEELKNKLIKDIEDFWKGAVEKRELKANETFPEEINGDIPIKKIEDITEPKRDAQTKGEKKGKIRVTFTDDSTLDLENQKLIIKHHPANINSGEIVIKAGELQRSVEVKDLDSSYKGGSVSINVEKEKGKEVYEEVGKATLDGDGTYSIAISRALEAGAKYQIQIKHPAYKLNGLLWTKWVQLNTAPLKESYDLGKELYDKLGQDDTLDKDKKDALKKAIEDADKLIDKDGNRKNNVPITPEGQKQLDDAKKAIDDAIKNLGGHDLLTLLPYLQVKALAVWENEKPSPDDIKSQIGLNDNVENDSNKDKIKATWEKVKDKLTFEILTTDTSLKDPKAMKMIKGQVKIKNDDGTSLNKNFDLYIYPDLAIDPNKDRHPSYPGFLPLPKDHGYLAFVPGDGIEKIKDNSLYIYKAKDDFKLEENQFPVLSADGEKVKDALLPSLKLKTGAGPVIWKAMNEYEIAKPLSGIPTYMREEDLLNNDFKDPKPTLGDTEVNKDTLITKLPKVKVLGEKGKEVTVLVAYATSTDQKELPKPVIEQGHNTANGEATITGTITGQPQGTKLALYILGNKVDMDPIPYDNEGKFTVTLSSSYTTSGVKREVYHGDSVEVKAYYEGKDASYKDGESNKVVLDKKAPEIKNIVSENMPGQAQKISGSIQDENLPGKITLKTSGNTTLKTVDVGDNGTFNVRISKPAKGESVVLVAEDKFGNKTDEIDMRSLAEQPQISAHVEQPFAGEMEILAQTVPGATVEVFTKNGGIETSIGSGVATFDSIASISLAKPLVGGQVLYIRATKYGYQKQATDIVMTVK